MARWFTSEDGVTALWSIALCETGFGGGEIASKASKTDIIYQMQAFVSTLSFLNTGDQSTAPRSSAVDLGTINAAHLVKTAIGLKCGYNAGNLLLP